MKICLNCQKEYQNKREASKYCSDKCRVAYNRKHPQNSVSKTQVQVLYNEMLEMMAKIKSGPLQDENNGLKSHPNIQGTSVPNFRKEPPNNTEIKDYAYYERLLLSAETFEELEIAGKAFEASDLLWSEKKNLRATGQKIKDEKFNLN